jgi:hypothetical protein
VLGDKEMEAKRLTVRNRKKGSHNSMALEEFYGSFEPASAIGKRIAKYIKIHLTIMNPAIEHEMPRID